VLSTPTIANAATQVKLYSVPEASRLARSGPRMLPCTRTPYSLSKRQSRRLYDFVTSPYLYLYGRLPQTLPDSPLSFGAREVMTTFLTIWKSFLHNPLGKVVLLFVVGTFLATVFKEFFQVRKIQPNGFKWRALRNEVLFALINLAISGFLLGSLTSLLLRHGYIKLNTAPANGWVIAAEYALYFFAFDTYFYWFHRLMHQEPIYSWVHRIHHLSTSPNVLTTLSVNPLESLINGGFVPLFTALLTVHSGTLALIGPTNILMGLYVHCGYEFLPRWWNRSWATRWFITATFHDQHHKYFRWNFGGYTPIWDFLCGTARAKYSAEFEQIRAKPGSQAEAA
jgi:sterol desaturase/sphingolipid hydroxylase (fatty acid hydroxylase superfamily)